VARIFDANSLAPGLVDINADACPIPQTLLDRGYMGNAVRGFTPADRSA